MNFSCEIYFENSSFFLNKEYISQDGGGSHLGCMHEQSLKIKNSVKNDFLIEKWYYTSFSDKK